MGTEATAFAAANPRGGSCVDCGTPFEDRSIIPGRPRLYCERCRVRRDMAVRIRQAMRAAHDLDLVVLEHELGHALAHAERAR